MIRLHDVLSPVDWEIALKEAGSRMKGTRAYVVASPKLSNEALFVNFTLLDFGTLLGWWGAMVAAIALAVASLGKNRIAPRWVAGFSLLMVALPLAMAVATGLPGLVGLTGPIWLIVVSLAQIFSRKIDA